MQILQNHAPHDEILQAFGVYVEPRLLEGGEGTTYRAGDIILKPAGNSDQTNWIAQMLEEIPDTTDFRINRPVPTRDNMWVHDDWQAFTYLAGKEVKGRCKEKIAVSRKFHKTLAHPKRPDFIGMRQNPWETADVAVWDRESPDLGMNGYDVVARLVKEMGPLHLPEQLIHGDMSGNILFHDTLPPAIIDVSPYWRPAEYATAIIIVDGILWENEDDSLIEELENTYENNQLLLRAALWRIKTTYEFSRIQEIDRSDDIHEYSHFVDLLIRRVSEQKK